MCEDLPDRARLRNERDQPDVGAAVRALEWKLLPHPGQKLGPGDPGGVVRAGFLMRVRAASRGVTVVSMSPGRELALLADVCDRQCRDGPPQPVVRRKHPVVAMAVLPRRWDGVCQTIEELKRRELHDAIGSRPRGLTPAARPDPGGGFVSGQRVADAGYPAVWAGGRVTGGCCDANPNQKPRSHDTSRIAWAKLMARVGEELPLECPNCGGDIRLIAFITEPGPIRKILTHLGEPLEPPPVSPARGPPTDWGELVQIHDDRDVFQASPDELPAIDIHNRL